MRLCRHETTGHQGEVQHSRTLAIGVLADEVIHWLLATILATLLTGPAYASKSAGTVVDDNTINACQGELIGNKQTKARHINVETYKGVVQLSGFVTTQAEKDEAGKVAKGVDGVKDVRNNIGSRRYTVRPEARRQCDDG